MEGNYTRVDKPERDTGDIEVTPLDSPEITEDRDIDIDSPRSPASPIGRMREALSEFVVDVASNEELFPWINVLLIAGVIGCVEYIPAAVLGFGIPTLGWLSLLYQDYGFYAQILCAIGTSIVLVAISATVGLIFPTTKGGVVYPISSLT